MATRQIGVEAARVLSWEHSRLFGPLTSLLIADPERPSLDFAPDLQLKFERDRGRGSG